MNLLIIDDDRFLTDTVGRFLVAQGYSLRRYHSAGEGFAAIAEKAPDLLILDLGLPDQDGLALCKRLRSKWNFPILMLTSRGESMDKVAGLEVGADDYLTKPFDAGELLARIKALLRRSTEYAKPDSGKNTSLSLGPLTIDREGRCIHVNQHEIEVTDTEFKILEYLAANSGRAISREMLFETIWGYDIEFSSNSLEVLIYRIRGKLAEAGCDNLIQTLRGYGYKLSA